MEKNSQEKISEIMMTQKIPCFALILFIAVAITLVSKENSFAIDDSRDYTIFFSGNVVGELDVCGWGSSKLGGLSRKATKILDISTKQTIPSLRLDAGNLLFKRQQNHAPNETSIVSARTIIDAYAIMDYDAIAVGPLDLAQGADFLIDHSPSQLSWISANIYGTDDTRIFPPYITVEKNGLSIAVIGITGKLRQNIDGITISNWEKELAEIIPSLSVSHNMILLLTTLSYKTVLAVTEKFPEIQIILGADLRKGNINGLMKNSTIVAQTASQGKYLGQLTVNWRYRPWGTDLETKQTAISNQLKSLIRQRAKLARYDSQGSSTYEKKKALLIEKQEQLTEELEELEKQAEDTLKTDQPSTYSTTFIPMSPSISEHPEIKAMVSAAGNK